MTSSNTTRISLLFIIALFLFPTTTLGAVMGINAVGSQNGSSAANEMECINVTAPESGTVTSLSEYQTNAGGNWKAVLAKQSDLTIVANGIGQATATGDTAWSTSTFSTPPSITSGTVYLLCHIFDSGIGWRYENIAGYIEYYDYDNSYASPGTLTSPNTSGDYYTISIYATYTTSGTPAVTTQAVSNISLTTATGNGNVTSDGGYAITERGVVWNTTGTPTTADSKATSAGTTGAFTADMTGLTSSTLYYVRAYATNSQGTSYGSQVTFTTLKAEGYNTLNRGLTGWWTFDGNKLIQNVTDSSTNGGYHGNMTGFTSTSTAVVAGKIGQALKFDGVNDTVQIPGNPFGTSGPVSISFWSNIKNNNGAYKIFMSSDVAPAITVGITADANRTFAFSNGAGSFGSAANSVVFDTWQHVVLVKDSSNLITFYVNGAVSGTPNQDSGSPTLGSTVNWIGAYRGTDNFLQGSLDDVRVYNRVLSTSEIRQLYSMGTSKLNVTANSLTSAIKQGLTGWWTMDSIDTSWTTGRETDKASGSYPGTLLGLSTTTGSVSGKIGQAMGMNGTTGYITTTAAISAIMSNATGTISAWFLAKPGNIAGCTTADMSGIVVDGTATGGYLWLGYDGANLCGGAFDGGYRNLSTAVPTGVWTHAVWVHQNGVLTLWKNGALAGSRALGNISDTTHPFHIGRSYSSNYFNGLIDDVRIYSTALSTSSIQKLYLTGAGTKQNVSINNPGSSLQNGLIGWWTFDGKNLINNASDMSGLNNNAYMMGFTSTSTAVIPGKLGQALNFNGSSSYVNGPVGLIGTNAASVCAWIKPSRPLVDGYILANDQFEWGTVSTNNNMIVTSNNGTAKYSAGQSIIPNKWQYVCVTRDAAGLANHYLNGAISGTADQSSGTPTSSAFPEVIGAFGTGGSWFYKGGIDDVRIYNRVLSAREIMDLYKTGNGR